MPEIVLTIPPKTVAFAVAITSACALPDINGRTGKNNVF